MTPTAFITRWKAASGTELANAHLFVAERRELLGLPRPEPASDDLRDNAYVFERRIRERLSEAIDAYRKRQQAAHPGLTLTGMYNVLEQLRRGVALNSKAKLIHEQGLVSVLASLHDELDAAVLEAYGWGDLAGALVGKPGGTLPYPEAAEAQQAAEAELLVRLVALNAERAAEEARGRVRWLRPDFQNPAQAAGSATLVEAELEGGGISAAIAMPTAAKSTKAVPKAPWPAELPTLTELFASTRVPLDVEFVGNGWMAAC